MSFAFLRQMPGRFPDPCCGRILHGWGWQGVLGRGKTGDWLGVLSRGGRSRLAMWAGSSLPHAQDAHVGRNSNTCKMADKFRNFRRGDAYTLHNTLEVAREQASMRNANSMAVHDSQRPCKRKGGLHIGTPCCPGTPICGQFPVTGGSVPQRAHPRSSHP